MSKSLLTVSLEDFQVQVYKITTKNLVSLLEGIVQVKWEYGKTFTDEQICDIERKHSKIEHELIRREYLGKADRQQYNEWFAKINKGKRQW